MFNNPTIYRGKCWRGLQHEWRNHFKAMKKPFQLGLFEILSMKMLKSKIQRYKNY